MLWLPGWSQDGAGGLGGALGAGQLSGEPCPPATKRPPPCRPPAVLPPHPPPAVHPPASRRQAPKGIPQGSGRKPRRRPAASPTGETPTIEEGEEEEDEASEAEGARALSQPPASTPSSVQVSGGRAPGDVCGTPGLASPAHTGPCSSSFSRRMKVRTGRQKQPVRLPLQCCPTTRQLPRPPKGPRLGKCPQTGTSRAGTSELRWGTKQEP